MRPTYALRKEEDREFRRAMCRWLAIPLQDRMTIIRRAYRTTLESPCNDRRSVMCNIHRGMAHACGNDAARDELLIWLRPEHA